MKNVPDVSNITAWQASSGWFYITMYKVKGDSSSLMPRKLPPQVIDFQIIESDESIQLGIRIKQPIENHDLLLEKKSIIVSAASMPLFIAVCEPLILGMFKVPASQPINNAPGIYIFGKL